MATAQAAAGSSSSANHSADFAERLRSDLIKRLVRKDVARIVVAGKHVGASASQIDPENRDELDETASVRGARRRGCSSLAQACSCEAN